ncbi:hypothetical protein E4T44_01345 [Aureobasidium sp. EXF-8845]|nr:hypothetical protein E4T44_01345 [Aureobasidium sp. EXF-8845]KAI4857238.1 hypothetical protein E4T45_01275 [Aureobasidium sp. EXF-8846]
MANSLTSLADEAMDELGYPAAPRLNSTAQRDGSLALNRNSTFLTRDHEFPPAKAYETNTRFKQALKWV